MNETPTKGPTVFIAHSAEDGDFARRLGSDLSGTGMNVFFGFGDILPDPSLTRRILDSVSSRDYIIFLLSSTSLRSAWFEAELQLAASEELADRAIEIIPVTVEDVRIPVQFKSWQEIDLSKDYSAGVDLLIDRIIWTRDLDFAKLAPSEFETLVADLLRHYDFRTFRAPPVGDQGYDLKAITIRPDAFGRYHEETWLVELKRYQDRVPLSTLQGFVKAVSSYSEPVKGLLVTTSRLTSVARHHLDNLAKEARIEVRVMEEPELRRLISAQPDLVSKYFPSRSSE